MSKPVVVFLGDFQDEHLPWNELVEHLGWTVRHVSTLEGLKEFRERETPAVYVEPNSGSLAQQVATIREWTPNARVVACYRLSSQLLADELVAAGAFHSVPRPLHLGELKQSLGFVWEAWSRKPKRVESIQRAASAAAA